MKLYWKIPPLNAETIGLIYGFWGVIGFSLTLPATRVAVIDLDPIFVGLGRGLVAAILAAATLRFTHQPIPSKQQLGSLLVVGLGVVVGFPVLSAWAMQQVPAAHGAVVLGLLPLATAIAGVLRAGDRPDFTFWMASIFGSTTVVCFGIISGAGHLQPADLALFGAVIAAAVAYAEGGRLAKVLGGWQVISWALVIIAPFEVLPTIFVVLKEGLIAAPIAWLGFAYVSLISQFIAFFAWYQGMAVGGVARVGQIQLLQPFLTILGSAILLGETVEPIAIGTACLVVASVAAGKKASIKRTEDL
ncbi:DMT family transporter [Microcoleus sp. F4-D5]|uniref:DMT family transporter n=1 Tax=Microcoleus sp. F4-D5 TaxID=2818760 RepID=UPI002FCEC452